MITNAGQRVPASEVKAGDVLEWWPYWTIELTYEVSRVVRHRDGHVTIRGSQTADLVRRGADRILYSRYPPDAPVWKVQEEM